MTLQRAKLLNAQPLEGTLDFRATMLSCLELVCVPVDV